MVEIHPEKRLIGYARVSTYGQTLDSQLEQLRAAGCGSLNIYREKVTSARADRRELNRISVSWPPATWCPESRPEPPSSATAANGFAASPSNRVSSTSVTSQAPVAPLR